jgi:SET domain-containing protein
MIVVPTYLGKSSIHGVGMFTHVHIPKDTIVWKFDEAFDRKFSDETKVSFPLHIQQYIERHGFKDRSGWWVIDGGHDQFVNHSDEPNLVERSSAIGSVSMILVAARDIGSGEELTENYMEWDQMVQLKKLGAL